MLKKLFTRFVLIVVLPIIILQAILAYIFYVRHWEKVSGKMESALSGELLSVLHLSQSEADFSQVAELARLMNLSIKFFPLSRFEEKIPKKINTDSYLRSFVANLKRHSVEKVEATYVSDQYDIRIFFENKKGVLQIDFSNKRLYSPTTYIFIIWMVGSATFLVLVAVIFMKNQVKSILRLVDAAEKLGKGQNVEYFKPSGAIEVRAAGKAFLLMKSRIERQIYFRTQMLAHISHDLRTPLTRIRLNTEFIKDRKTAEEINIEISKMEELIEEYLNFAKEEGNEHSKEFNMVELLQSIIGKYQDSKIKWSSSISELLVNLKKHAIERVVINLVDNALKYAESQVVISLDVKNNNCYLTFDDDGKGIAKEYYKKVFKPFYKIDENTKGFGLGLAIVKSIIYGHGGKIKLAKSYLGGLSVVVKIPL